MPSAVPSMTRRICGERDGADFQASSASTTNTCYVFSKLRLEGDHFSDNQATHFFPASMLPVNFRKIMNFSKVNMQNTPLTSGNYLGFPAIPATFCRNFDYTWQISIIRENQNLQNPDDALKIHEMLSSTIIIIIIIIIVSGKKEPNENRKM